MDRRIFMRSLAFAATATGVGGAAAFGSLLPSAKDAPRVAITMDDFSLAEKIGRASCRERV